MIFAFLFGLIYSNITLAFRSPPNVFTPFYYSIVTFTTLGFGDVIPTNFWGEFWVTFEVILGYVMLGGLISIFANKIARRS
jgi:predicted permease